MTGLEPGGVPARVSRWRLLGVLRDDAQGVACEGEDAGRRVEVRLFRAPPGCDAETAARLERRFVEGLRAVGGVSSPHVQAVLEVGRDAGRAFAVLDLPRGVSLDRLIGRGLSLSLEQVCELADQVAAGLEAVHAQGVVHGSLCPSCVVVEEDGTVKLTGFAAAAGEGDQPEAADDLAALGRLLREVMAGRAQADAAARHGALGAGVPSGLERLVDRLLAGDPAGRFVTAADVRAAVSILRAADLAQESRAVAASREESPPREAPRARQAREALSPGERRTRAVAVIAVAVAAAAAVLALAFADGGRVSRDRRVPVAGGGWAPRLGSGPGQDATVAVPAAGERVAPPVPAAAATDPGSAAGPPLVPGAARLAEAASQPEAPGPPSVREAPALSGSSEPAGARASTPGGRGPATAAEPVASREVATLPLVPRRAAVEETAPPVGGAALTSAVTEPGHAPVRLRLEHALREGTVTVEIDGRLAVSLAVGLGGRARAGRRGEDQITFDVEEGVRRVRVCLEAPAIERAALCGDTIQRSFVRDRPITLRARHWRDLWRHELELTVE